MKHRTSLYPLQFDPLYKDRIWGGTKLKTCLGKDIPSDTIGESWEISTVDSDISVVNKGTLKGVLLTDLLAEYGEEILGSRLYGQFHNKFPLLFKFLDAKEDLSIQLHPNDALAMERHNSLGKTEMWYIMQADSNAAIIVGFNQDVCPEDYLHHLESKTLPKILKRIPVKKGEVYFLETGTIHAIGSGILIAEIQQTSDITYRIYDWDRVDSQGNKRELHVDLALEAINYKEVDGKRDYQMALNTSNAIVDCPFFTTNIILLDGAYDAFKAIDCFRVLLCTEGSFELLYSGDTYVYQKGDTVLLPACLGTYALKGKADVLEIYIS